MVKTRVDWVDVAKGICILFVVMMHSTLGVEKAAGAEGWMGYLVAFAKPFRMPDFFLISGLFLSRVIDRPAREFLDKRVQHFWYFYLVWVVIQFAVKAPGMAADIGGAETARQFLLALTVEPFGTLWFIWMLPVFALVVRHTRHIPMPLMLVVAALMEIGHLTTGWTAIDEFAARFVYFYAGYALSARVFTLAAGAAAAPGLALAGLGLWALANGSLVAAGASEWPLVSLAMGGAGALAIVTSASLLARTGGAVAALLRYCGENSIVIYLAFFLPMAAMRTLLLKTGVIADIGSISLLVTVFAAATPFAMRWLTDRLGLDFLFVRPQWARLDRKPLSARMHPAAAE